MNNSPTRPLPAVAALPAPFSLGACTRHLPPAPAEPATAPAPPPRGRGRTIRQYQPALPFTPEAWGLTRRGGGLPAVSQMTPPA